MLMLLAGDINKHRVQGRVKMSLEEKIRNAKETDWITDGIPKWQVSLIVFFTKLKVKCRRLLHI